MIFICLFVSYNLQAQTNTAEHKVKKEKKAKKVKKAKKGKVAKFEPVSQDPVISLESDVVDFGTIEKGSEPFRTLVVMNQGAQPLVISNCSGSCGCTVPTCPTTPVLPGEKAEIKIRYDTNRVGPISKTVTIKSNDPSNPVKTVAVKGLINNTAK